MGCVAGTLRQQRPSSEPSMGPRVEGLTGQGGRPRAPQQVGEGKADQGCVGPWSFLTSMVLELSFESPRSLVVATVESPDRAS